MTSNDSQPYAQHRHPPEAKQTLRHSSHPLKPRRPQNSNPLPVALALPAYTCCTPPPLRRVSSTDPTTSTATKNAFTPQNM